MVDFGCWYAWNMEVLNVNVCLTIFVALPGLFDGMLERMLSVQNGVLLNISIQAM